jgi:regulator of sigma E protease
MLTFLIFIVVISVLVFVHELGHFVMAKRAKMKVEEFGFGFPPRIWGKRYGDTLYSINAIPFGGFVRIFGENGENRRAPGSFGAGTFWQKVAVIVAGVAMNFVFAAFLLMLGNGLGLRVGVFDETTMGRAQELKVQVLQIAPGSPAEQGGLRPLDEIIGFRENGSVVRTETPEKVQEYAFSHAGKPVTMVVVRGQDEEDLSLTLRQPSGPSEGPIGISLALTGVVRHPWYTSIWLGVTQAAAMFWATLVGYFTLLFSLVTSGNLGADVSGPVGIATLTGQAARIGFNYLIQFVAMISINLAVLNILPFPALDGGRLVIVLAEKLRGKSLSEHVEEAINAIGFFVLILLMVAVTVKDIVKFF